MTYRENSPQVVRLQMAQRIADRLTDGDYVNLGIGIPTLVANYIPTGRDVVLHSENGLLGMVGLDSSDLPDPDLIDAGKRPVNVLPGGAFFDQSLSFAMIRGGHLDVAVLGAFEVSSSGDLANWSLGRGRVSGVGGAMDLAVGTATVLVAMMHRTRTGEDRLVRSCQLPLTASGVVDTVFTELGTFKPCGDWFEVIDLMPGVEPTTVVASEEAAGLYRF